MQHNEVYQETEGYLSPWLRDQRLQRVAKQIPDKSIVLDLACGAGYLGRLIEPRCRYFGADRVVLPEESVVNSIYEADFSKEGWELDLKDRLPSPPNVITLLAFLEHITDRQEFLLKCSKLLTGGGIIIGTTPHPRGRSVHDVLAKVQLCSKKGADEHEDFLDREELSQIATACGGRLSKYDTFLWGLNQLFVISF